MQEFIDREDLSPRLILKYVKQADIFEKFGDLKVSRGKFKNPLRSDNKPSCYFFVNSYNKIKFVDQAKGTVWDCFDFVQQKFSCDFNTALKIIADEFNVDYFGKLKRNTPVITPIKLEEKEKEIVFLDSLKENKQIKVVASQKYSKKFLNYWSKYQISETTLKKFQVFEIESAFYDNKMLVHKPNNICAGYLIENKYWKIYQPFNQSHKWFSDSPLHSVQGTLQIDKDKDLLIITKSLKDVMCLYELGITAISPQSETTFIRKDRFEKLKTIYKHIIIFFDNDETGIEKSKKFSLEYEIPYIILDTKEKDLSDYIKVNSLEKTKEKLNSLLYPIIKTNYLL